MSLFDTIKGGMQWPPPMSKAEWKISEYSAWYSGDSNILINYYSINPMLNQSLFWTKKANKSDIRVHVPMAGEIAESSANILFGESPYIRTNSKALNKQIDITLKRNEFYSKIIEAAELAAALGGVFIKHCWDSELSEYPIPVITQPDRAIPLFKFGILDEVLFWKKIRKTETDIYYLIERYYRGGIETKLFKGTDSSLKQEVDLSTLSETQGIAKSVTFKNKIIAAVYVPNMRPNKIDRGSYIGRSDYAGCIDLLHSLDETYSAWIRDIRLAKARLLIPEKYLNTDKEFIDEELYVMLDCDPLNNTDITPQQFAIRATEFQLSMLSLIERIVSSSGYSPQTFGLNIEGRAESGTALNIRERKTYDTKGKKENYWYSQIEHLVVTSLIIANEFLGAKINLAELEELQIEFSDEGAKDSNRIAQTLKLISDASAASTEVKVRMLHPDWEEEAIQAEVLKIKEENTVSIPEFNLDNEQLNNADEEIDEE